MYMYIHTHFIVEWLSLLNHALLAFESDQQFATETAFSLYALRKISYCNLFKVRKINDDAHQAPQATKSI